MVKLRFPYIASFLGFREVPALLEQVEKLRKLESEEKREIFPQIIMVSHDCSGWNFVLMAFSCPLMITGRW